MYTVGMSQLYITIKYLLYQYKGGFFVSYMMQFMGSRNLYQRETIPYRVPFNGTVAKIKVHAPF